VLAILQRRAKRAILTRVNTVTPEILSDKYKYTHYLLFNQWGFSVEFL
jgi:hypothetical protein